MNKKNKKKTKPYKKNFIGVERKEYDYHLPVFLKTAVDYLVTNPDGSYIDGTLGGGGHTEEILRRLGDLGELHSFDRDELAIEHCRSKLRGELERADKSRLTLHNECYSNAVNIQGIRGRFDGILLDLGLSSRQLDESRRGFSYRLDTPLDMRFGPDGKTAEEILHAAKEEEITTILRKFGEEPFAGKIARRIIERRRAFLFKTTFDLRAVVEESVPNHLLSKTLSRVFQAFRIAVNHELEVLDFTLHNCLKILNPNARIVVMSYHSLEDRIVKTFFKEHSSAKQKYNSDNEVTKSMPLLKILTNKPLIPDDAEIAGNPRARSAKLRVAEVILNSEF